MPVGPNLVPKLFPSQDAGRQSTDHIRRHRIRPLGALRINAQQGDELRAAWLSESWEEAGKIGSRNIRARVDKPQTVVLRGPHREAQSKA